MIQLFPQFQKRILLYSGIWLGFLAAAQMLFPVFGLGLMIFASIAGILAIIFMQAVASTSYHNRILTVLYNELNAERFLSIYEPLLDVKVKNRQLHVMVRLHLSNAYCAQGRFDEAEEVLKGASFEGMKPEQEMLSRFAVISNLCYCAEQMNNLSTAEQYLDQLHEIKAKLEEMQKSKPEKKRMTFSTALNDHCFKFLKTGEADIEFLKSQVQANNTQQLHRITSSLWVARAYLSVNNRREAEKLLLRITELAPDLYPGRCAKEMLDQLPAKNDK